MKRAHWISGDEGERPAGKKGECFYCNAARGTEHAVDCVMRRKTVIVKVSFEVLVDVPEEWDAAQIDFWMNGSSYCLSNMVDAMAEQVARWEGAMDDDGNHGCFCHHGQGAFVRDATEDDEAAYNRRVKDIPC